MDGSRYFGLTPTQLNLAFVAVVGAVALAGFLYFGGVSAVQGLFDNNQPSQQAALEETPTPAAAQPASTECSQLAVGCDALVTNTGTTLNLRDTPSMNGTIFSHLQDGTAVTIKGGPTQSDGYVWWQILASGSLGWAAEGDASGTKWLVPIVAGSSEIGPEVVWDGRGVTGDDLFNALRKGTTADVIEAIRRYGASEQTVEFFRETGDLAMSFTETGKVDVVSTILLGQDNALAYTVLVNGSPRILVLKDIDLTSLATHPYYAEFAATTSDFDVYYPESWLEEITTSPSGGQSFVFSVFLTNRCRVCEFGVGRVAFDFAPHGTYEGWRALESVNIPEAGCRDEGHVDAYELAPLLLCYEGECGNYLLEASTGRGWKILSCVTECPPENPYPVYQDDGKYMPAGTYCYSWQP